MRHLLCSLVCIMASGCTWKFDNDTTLLIYIVHNNSQQTLMLLAKTGNDTTLAVDMAPDERCEVERIDFPRAGRTNFFLSDTVFLFTGNVPLDTYYHPLICLDTVGRNVLDKLDYVKIHSTEDEVLYLFPLFEDDQ